MQIQKFRMYPVVQASHCKASLRYPRDAQSFVAAEHEKRERKGEGDIDCEAARDLKRESKGKKGKGAGGVRKRDRDGEEGMYGN